MMNNIFDNNIFLKRKLSKNNYNYKFSDYTLKNINLLYIFFSSYKQFLNFGLKDIFINKIFPIYSYKNNYSIDFVDYKIIYPKKSPSYSMSKGLTYCVSIILFFDIYSYKDSKNNSNFIKFKIKRDHIIIPNIPFITEKSTFIINGIEKAIVSKFIRSPGLYFINEFEGKNLNFIIKLVPDKGNEMDFIIDFKNNLYLKFNKKKIFILDILKSYGFNNYEILNLFYNFLEVVFLKNEFKIKFDKIIFLNYNLPYDIVNSFNEIIVEKNKIINSDDIDLIIKNNIEYILIDKNFLINKILGCNLYHNNLKFSKILDEINSKILEKIIKFKIEKIILILYEGKTHSSIFLNLKNNRDFFISLNTLNDFLNFYGNKIFDFNILNYNSNFFKQYFFIGPVCRKKINFYFKKNFNFFDFLNIKDIINIIKLLISFKDGFFNKTDNLNISNLNLYLIGDILNEIFLDFFLNLKKEIRKNFFDFNFYSLNKFFKISNLLSKIKKFFSVSRYCQYLDELNILSEISHKRRVTFLGVIGISKKYSGFDSRDLNSSHYSKICPVETPEGINIGLVSSLAILCKVDKNHFLVSPYYKISNGKTLKKWIYLSVDQEFNSFISDSIYHFKSFENIDSVLSKYGDQLIATNPKLLNYVNVVPYQMLSLSALLIPFIENNDSNRALMASNMMKQTLPLIFPEPPIVSTGLENIVSLNSYSLLKSLNKCKIIYRDSRFILSKKIIDSKDFYYYEYDIYFLLKYISSNQKTSKSQRNLDDKKSLFYKDDVLADGSCTKNGDLAIGQNVMVAFMPWEGYNFEDSIIVSEKLLFDEKFTSLELLQIDISVLRNNDNSEILTKNIFDYNKTLNKYGIIKTGSRVYGGDILLGKIFPFSKDDENPVDPNHRIIYSMYNKDEDFNSYDTSFYLPEKFGAGTILSSEIYFSEDSFFEKDFCLLNYQSSKILFSKKKKYLFIKKKIKNMLKNFLINKYFYNNNNLEIIDNNFIKSKKFNQILNLKLHNYNHIKIFEILKKKINFFLKIFKFFKKNIKFKFFKNISSNLSKIVRVIIILKKKLQVGDKMSGRHGNKGVVSKILSPSEMPYLFNGKTIDIILNPLGVPSRMNVGQLLEIHLGFSSVCLSWKVFDLLNQNKSFTKIKNLLFKIYDNKKINFILNSLDYSEILNLVNFLKNGIQFSINPFSNFNENIINNILNFIFEDGFLFDLGISKNQKQIFLYDGRTGKKFINYTTIGLMYILKLNHLAEDKIHSRSVGPYSMITQQPLKGKSNKGGQRLGEMEVWALEAYGSFYSLQEMLTIKSDDILGRFEAYKNIIKGINNFNFNRPETFNVMIKNINSLLLYIRFDEY